MERPVEAAGRPGLRIGIDLGGTKIEAVAIDRQGVWRARRRIPTPAGDYPATLRAIADLVEALEREIGVPASVGLGIPGAISPASGLVKNANSTWLISRPIERDLAVLLARPVRIANDANCFALSEAIDGAGRDHPVVFGVILGTGVGGAIVLGGRIHRGPNAIAGEWGHTPLPWAGAAERPGPRCYCGKAGCIETFLSGPALQRDFGADTGRDSSAPEIVRAAARGDAASERALARYEDRLARALAVVINTLDPDCIVLGGGLSNIERLYRNVPSLWPRYVFSDTVATPLRRPVHGDSGGARGAAWLWPG